MRVHSASIRRSREPTRAGSAFTPSLQTVIPAGSTLLLDVKRPRPARAAAAGRRRGGRRRWRGSARCCGGSGGAQRRRGQRRPTILSLFAGETAVAIVPAASSQRARAGDRRPHARRGRRPRRARRARGAARAAVRRPSLGPRPGARRSTTACRPASPPISCRSAPGLQLDYAVFHGLVVISTSLDRNRRRGLQNSRPRVTPRRTRPHSVARPRAD